MVRFTQTRKFWEIFGADYRHFQSDLIERKTSCVVYISNEVFWLNRYLRFIQQLP